MTSVAPKIEITEEMVRKAVTRMEQARQEMIGNPDLACFGAVAMRLRIVPSFSVHVMSTDTVHLMINPLWVLTAPFDHVIGVFCHEILHCGLGHPFRLGEREFVRWNMACDFAINPLLIASGLKLPADGLNNPAYHGMSAEEIYNRLPVRDPDDDPDTEPGGDEGDGGGGGAGEGDDGDGDQDGDGDTDADAKGDGDSKRGGGKKPGKQPGSGTGTFEMPTHDDGSVWSEAEITEKIQEWEEAMTTAAAVAEKNDHLPEAFKDWSPGHGRRRPTVDWRVVSRDFVTASATNGQSWVPPNRRHVYSGLYLPSYHSKKLGRLAIIVDVSGSTWSGDIYERFTAEMKAIAEEMEPDEITVLYWDEVYQGHDTYSEGETPEFRTRGGGGGTSFQGVWPWLETNNVEPDCAVFFTDMMCWQWGAQPSYPVLWAAITAMPAPWGQVVRLDKD